MACVDPQQQVAAVEGERTGKRAPACVSREHGTVVERRAARVNQVGAPSTGPEPRAGVT